MMHILGLDFFFQTFKISYSFNITYILKME